MSTPFFAARLNPATILTGVEITLGMAQQVLKSTLAAQEKKVNIDAIQKVVADEFRLRVADLKAKNNSRNVVHPRQIAMFLCRELASVSLPEIGRSFGGKHHTTVLHSIEKIRENCWVAGSSDALIQALYRDVTRFAANTAQQDGLTAIVLKRIPRQ